MDFLVRAAQLILSLSILVALHEFGHYITARWFKTRVEKFYLFFNPWFSLFKKKIGDTEWGIGWLPLGGYVKIAGMIDESMDKEQMAQPAQPWEFRSKPAWQRLIIMMGGVIVNVILGFIIYIAVLAVYGEQKMDYSKMQHGIMVHPYLEQFGFQNGDKIISVDGEKYTDPVQKLGMQVMIFNKRNFVVEHQNGEKQTIVLPENIGDLLWKNEAEGAFDFRYLFGKIEKIDSLSTAKRVGLKVNDKIVAVNGKEITYFDEFRSTLFHNRGKKCDFEIRRGDSIIKMPITVNNKGILGVVSTNKVTTDTSVFYNQDYGIGAAFAHGFSKGYHTIYMNVAQFKYVATKRGATSVGGFGTIGKLFPTSWDWEAFWMLTAFLSFMLAVMNMLPIPALDGGHVMFLLYEMITGKAPSQRFMEIAQYVGFIILLTLILYANGKDLFGLFN
jgi:regulator of sigma E protease